MSDDRKDLPPIKSANFLEKVREAVQVYLGNRGDVLDRGVTLRDLYDAGMVSLRSGLGRGGGSPITGPGTGLEPAYETDLTPPPTPSDFAATAAISNLILTCGAPTYTQGHGHAKSKLYGATWVSGALPVFANAVVITEFNGTVASYATNPATTWRLWLTWVSVDGVESTVPAGGTNGVVATTGQDVADLLTALAGEITAGELATSLNTRIDLIDASAAVDGSVAFRVAAEALLRSQADITEVNARVAAVTVESIARTAQVQDVAYAALEATLAANGINTAVRGDVALARLELNQNVVDGVAAEAALRLILAAKLDTDIGTTLAAVTNESVARANGDSAEASARTTLASQILGADGTSNTAGLIYSERTTRVAEDNALAQQITLLSAGAGEQFDWKAIWYFDSGVESWTGNGVPTATAGFLRPADQASGAYVESPIGINSEGAKYNQLRLRVRKVGTPTWAGYLWWRAVADATWDVARRVTMTAPDWDATTGIGLVTVNPAWAVTIDRIRVDLSSAQTATDYFELDWVAIGRPSPGASSAQLLTEQTARVDGDAAVAATVTVLSAQVNNATTGLPAAHSLIATEQTARADGDSAEATARGVLAARVTTAEGNISTNAGAIVTEQGVRADADGVLTTNLNALTATVTGVDGVLDTQAVILAEQAVQASLTDAIARENRTLVTQSRELDAVVLTNLLTSEAARTSFTGTVALAREDLTSRIIVGELAEAEARLTLAALVDANAAALTTEQLTRATADSALASDTTVLAARVTTAEGDILTNAASITSEQSARADADTALASRATALEAAVLDIDGTLLTKATIAYVDQAEVDAISAAASTTALVQAQLNTGGTTQVAIAAAQTQANTATTNAATAQTTANTAVSNAATAQTAANTANTALTNLASDGILSPSEKPSVVLDYTVITGEQAGIDAQATSYGITTEKTNYDTAVSALTTYLGTLAGWNTVPGSDVVIVGTTFRAKFSDVYTQRQLLLDAIAAQSKLLADNAQSQANTATTNAATAQAQANTATTNAATAQTTANTAVSASSANATAISTTQARLDSGDYAAVKAESSASASAITGIKALYTIKLDVNNHVSGYGIYADATGNSEFIANVNKFAVTTPTSSIPPWYGIAGYTSGQVARIVTGGVDSYPSKTLVCLTDGVSGGTAPVLSGAIGSKVIDGSVVWQIASRVPFAVLSVPTTINGTAVPAGVYIDAAYVLKATIQGAQIAQLAVDDTHIVSLSVAKLTAGSIDVGEYIQASNYVAGTSGWRIHGDGTAELANAVVRGSVYASAGLIGGITIASNAVRAGQTAYNTGTGFYLGSDGRFSLGNAAGNSLTWNGSTLTIKGNGEFSGYVNATSGYFAGTLAAGTATFDSIVSNSATEFTGMELNCVDSTWTEFSFYMTHPGVVSVTGCFSYNSSSMTFSAAAISLVGTGHPVPPTALETRNSAGIVNLALNNYFLAGWCSVWLHARCSSPSDVHVFRGTLLRSYR